jgi:predicted Zn-dependent protease
MIAKYLNRLAISFLVASLACLSVGLYGQQTGDLLFKVMQDELDRSMGQLVMQDLEKAYFISYTIDDYQQLEVASELGTLLRSKLDRNRYLTTDVRTGDYSLDNSNFVSGYRFGADYTQLSLDDNYDAIRNQIYLATDAAYKDALETLSKKRAYLQSRVTPNRPDDFIKLPPNKYLGKAEAFDIDKAVFEDLAKAATAVFRDYPAIISSELKVTASLFNQYLVNSGGTRTLRGDRIYGFELTMTGKSSEGDDLADGDRIVVKDFASIPTKTALVSWAKANADRMDRLVKADTLDEYSGPVVFTGDAAGEFFRQLLVKNISNLPAALYENEQMAQMMGGGGGSDFLSKINRRILPATFTVYDDPTVNKVGSAPVIGGYPVDDAGGVPQRITLVENGKLINLPVGDVPTKKIKEPNGHARGALGKDVTAKTSNLVVTSTDKVPYATLKQTLISMCKDVDLPYGLIIKRVRDMGVQSAGGFSFFPQPNQSQEGLTVPYEVYKVYADGREEPVRNLQFNNVTVRILKDIQQTDDQAYVYNYLVGNDYEMPASIVAPSILVEEMELKKSEEKVKKPPLLPSPLAEK